jgi:formate dehydrogenase major subunit
MGSNMAEAHPVAFANVVRAKELGAKVIHVDPHYSRTSALVREDFQDTEELDGLFSGYHPASGTYTDQRSWDYQRDENGQPLTDPSQQNPRCKSTSIHRGRNSAGGRTPRPT